MVALLPNRRVGMTHSFDSPSSVDEGRPTMDIALQKGQIFLDT
jgi:hypothetical protein